MLKVDAGPKLVEAVGTHHTGGEAPGGLAGLIHVSNNLCKDLGLGYLPDEEGVYSDEVLETLELTEEDIKGLKEEMEETITNDVKELVSRCIPAAPKRAKRRRQTEEQPVPAAEVKPASPQTIKEKRDQLFETIDRIRELLEQDQSIEQEERYDMLVDIDTVRAQLDKKTPNRNALLALLEPLSERISPSSLIARVIQLVREVL